MGEQLTKEYLLSIINGEDDLIVPNDAEIPSEDSGQSQEADDLNTVFQQSADGLNQSSSNPSPDSSTSDIQQIRNAEPVKVSDLSGFIEIMTTAPTHTPKNFYDQVKYCTADSKLYFYDTINKTWKKSAAFT